MRTLSIVIFTMCLTLNSIGQTFYGNTTIHVTMDNVRDTFPSSHEFIIDSENIQWNGISILIQHLEDEIYRDRIQTKKGEFYINKKNGIIEQISYFPDGRYFIREKDIDKSKTRCLVFKYL